MRVNMFASCSAVLFKVLYYRLKMLSVSVCLWMYYLYYKLITLLYYIASSVSWVPRLTSLDLQTDWTYEHALGKAFVHI